MWTQWRRGWAQLNGLAKTIAWIGGVVSAFALPGDLLLGHRHGAILDAGFLALLAVYVLALGDLARRADETNVDYRLMRFAIHALACVCLAGWLIIYAAGGGLD